MTDPAAERRERVLASLVQAGPAGVSGEVLAGELGCSRAAVHRHVEALRRAGWDVPGEHGGYRLADDQDPVVARLVQPRLTPPLAGPVTWFDELASTNDEATRRARDGEVEGAVVGADTQTAGRGRRGRRWEARRGESLLFSVTLRPRRAPVEAGLLPLVAALAVADALGAGARIVWPNDVLLADHKVAGILCETSTDHERIAWTVVGIGINVHGAPRIDDPRWQPGWVARTRPGVRRSDLLVAVLHHLAVRYAEWDSGDVETLTAAYAARDALAGRMVTVAMDGDDVRGVGEGIDPLGRLRLRPLGSEAGVRLSMGEVTRITAITTDG